MNNCDRKWKVFGLLIVVFFLLGLFFVNPVEALRLKTNWATRVDLSEKALQGEVIAKRSYWNTKRTRIYTDVTILVDEHIKGNGPREIILTLPGGTVDKDFHWVSDTPQFNVGDYNVILLGSSGAVIGGPDGVYPLQRANVEVSQLRENINIQSREKERFLSWIKSYVNGETRSSFEEEPEVTSAAPLELVPSLAAISGVSPSSLSAGTGTVLTISGNGFGSSRGSGNFPTIAFRYKDSDYMYDNLAIKTWSDTQIRVEVWTGYVNNYHHSPGSWSDTVAFVNSSGISEYTYSLDVTFGYGREKWSTSAMTYYLNSSGGPSETLTAIQNAASTWNGAGANFSLNYGGTDSCVGDACFEENGRSVLSFSDLGDPGIIAWAIVYGTDGVITEADIQFNSGFSWSTSSPTPSDRMDLQTIALHEMGHWLKLLDLYGDNDTEKVMYGFCDNGITKRTLQLNDQSGINWIYPSCTQPGTPSNPNPQSGATSISTSPTLSWSAASNTNTYDVYFGTAQDPPRVVTDTTDTSYSPPVLNNTTKYYWKIVAKNTCNSSSAGPVWNFTTGTCPSPSAPSNPSPSNGAQNVPINSILTWTATSNTDYYEVFFCNIPLSNGSCMYSSQGTTNTPSYSPPSAFNQNVTIRWYVKAWNNCGYSNDGPTWSFTTGVCSPPNAPSNPNPSNGATGVPTSLTMSWTSSNADSYDVYFGTSNPPPLVPGGSITSTSYSRSGLSYLTTYFWKIVAKNSCQNQNPGPVWSFTTLPPSCPTPGTPSNPFPANGATGVTIHPIVSFDPCPDTDYYDVYGGLSSNNLTHLGKTTSTSYLIFPQSLTYNTTYYWKIIARNSCGMSQSGPVWHFSTVLSTCAAPGSPSNPSPSNSASGISTNPTLSWSPCSNATAYTVLRGTSSTNLKVVNTTTTNSFSMSGLNYDTVYYWRIIARDNCGLSVGTNTTPGPVWHFTTVPRSCQAPGTPSNPTPPAGAKGIPINITLSWTSSNADSYDVYFGTSPNPPPVGNTSSNSFARSGLDYVTKYYWKIVAKRNCGNSTPGAIWSFTTGSPGIDFDGDSKSDILWQHTNGTLAIWFMDGTTVGPESGGFAMVPSVWEIKGTRDFDGDGKSDILWQHTDGTLALWFMNGTTVLPTSGGFAMVPSVWEIKGVGDFNGDSRADILWQNTDGTVAIWFMDGTTVLPASGGFTMVPSAWEIKGIGDFNGDSRADILWQNADGTVAIWFMNGTTVLPTSGGFAMVPSAWQIKNVGDFDGDSKSDILWQHTDGTLAIWFMDGTTVLPASGGFAMVPSVWQIKGVSDFDGDSRSDILWRHTDGTLAIWFMNGTTVLPASGGVAVVPSAWKIMNQ